MTIPVQLLKPIQLGGQLLKNRIALAPMTRARAGAARIPNSMMAEYYRQRSGAGLVITEATVISEQAIGWAESPGIYTDAMQEGWRETVDAVHAAGSVIYMQLWHCGRASHSSFHPGQPAVAPSAVKLNGEYIHTPQGKQPYETPHALEVSEIHSIIEDYRHAAKRAKEVGFDGVEIHSANGYLLDTFLQSKTNLRTDEYGGSKEKRCKMLSEVVQAVSQVYPTSRIGVRFSPNGVFNDMGSADYRDQFLYAAEKLSPLGLSYLHVMDGLAFGFHQLGEPMTLDDFRGVYKGCLMGNCGYNGATAEEAIATGKADMIAIGRPFISNPDLVERLAKGLPLAPDSDISTWYTPTGAKGYIDFPTAGSSSPGS